MSPDPESIERAAFEDVHRAVPPHLIEPLRWSGSSIGGAFAGIAGALPASAIVLNRTIGLGLQAPASEGDVARIVAAYAQAGVARYFVHCHPNATPPELPGWLQAAGLRPARGWQKFERGPGPVPAAGSDLKVRPVGPECGPAFARIVCDAFDLGDAALPWMAAIPGRADWHVFMSFDGDAPAGGGALYVQGELAWLDFACTAPGFRRRGSQSALLAHRVRHALALGCRCLMTCTGEAAPGDPQHSYANILRAGFRETVLRANFAPPRR